MIDFFFRTDIMGMGVRMRQLSEKLTADQREIHELYGLTIQPKWFEVFFSLMGRQERSVTEIAREIGLSHPAVVKILKEMAQAGIATTRNDEDDKRRTLARLTNVGLRMEPQVELMCLDLERALKNMGTSDATNLWEALDRWEAQLATRRLVDFVAKEKEEREKNGLQIVSYDDTRHHDAFRKLNERWIRDLFTLRENDLEEISHPMERIIDQGGYIYMAEYNGRPVGTFALARHDGLKYDWELVKFAVDPGIQGIGIGKRLIETVIRKARQTGGYRLFLESNHKCAAAIHLYEKYGFKHLPVLRSQLERYDVQMELIMK